jgi:magnesium-transporting ATPase (P-type)
LVLTEYICFDKTGTLTVDHLKVKAILFEDAAFKFKEKLFKAAEWKNFK